MADVACPLCGRNLGDERFFAQGTLCAACAAEAAVDPATAAEVPDATPVEASVTMIAPEVDPAAVTVDNAAA